MLAELLHKVAAQEYQEKEDSHYYPRPSLSGPDRCIRQMVYWKMETPATPLPGRAAMVFDDSNWHEELTADWIRKTAYKFHSKDLPTDSHREGYPFRLKGKIDGIIQDIMDYDRHYEHKAINHFKFYESAKGKPPLDNLSQVCVYIDGLSEICSEITESILLLKNKNTAQYLEFSIEYLREKDLCLVKSMIMSGEGMDPTPLNLEFPNIVRDSFAKFQAVEEFASRKELPPRQYAKDYWRCEYCQYHEVCWANYEAEFQTLGTGADLQDMEELCAYYLETAGHLSEMKKENEELKEKIKKALLEKGVREGTTDRYIIKNNLIKSMRIDKTLIPAPFLGLCEKEGFSERLSINLKKEFKKKEAKENGAKIHID